VRVTGAASLGLPLTFTAAGVVGAAPIVGAATLVLPLSFTAAGSVRVTGAATLVLPLTFTAAGTSGSVTTEIPVRTAVLSAVVAALNAAAVTIDGDALTIELGRTDAVPEDARPLLAVIGGDMQPTDGGDAQLTRYEMRLVLAGYLAATTQAAAEEQANLLHASVVRALVRPNPAAPPVSILLGDGITDVIVEELAMRVEPASVTQSEAPMADLAAEFLAVVNTPYGNPFITA
jgi:hypothetical protein